MAYSFRELQGQVISNKYILTKFLDEGGSSGIFEFRGLYDQNSDVSQVISLTPFPDDRRARRRVRQDLVQSMWLSHPNIVRTFEAGLCIVSPVSEELPFFFKRLQRLDYTLESIISLEHIHQGIDLNDVSDRINLARQVLENVGNAILYLNYNSLTHVDLNPQNVMWNGSAWQLIDFESSATTERSIYVTGVHVNPMIVAPEASNVIRKYRTNADGLDEKIQVLRVTPEWDLYCLGAILFQILTGKLPCSVTSTSRTWQTDAVRKAALERHLGEHARNPLAEIVMSLSSRVPADRGSIQQHFKRVDINPLNPSEEANLKAYSIEANIEPTATHVAFTDRAINLSPVIDAFESDHGLHMETMQDLQMLLRSDEIDIKLQEVIGQIGLTEYADEYLLPPLIVKAQGRLASESSKGKAFFIEEKVMLRNDLELVVANFQPGDRIAIQKTDYLKSLITQEFMRAADSRELRMNVAEVDGEDVDLFSLYVEDDRPLPAGRVRGSSHVGASTLAFTHDGIMMMPTQGSTMIGARSYVPASSGSADWLHDTHRPDGALRDSLEELVVNAMKRELVEEGGLHSAKRRRPKLFKEGDRIHSKVLGYGRLVGRAFKPEFYGVSVTSFAFSDFKITSDEKEYIISHNIELCVELGRKYFGNLEGVTADSVKAYRNELLTTKQGRISCALEICLNLLIRDLNRDPDLLLNLRA